MEVVRSRQGGLGTRAVLPWNSLYPVMGPEGEESALLAGETPTQKDLTPDFYRARALGEAQRVRHPGPAPRA